MIARFTDHAANERTFLAWVRTAIAVIAFGFLVEKFDLFLEVTVRSLQGGGASVPFQMVGNVAGLLIIALGGILMVMATVRFRQTGRDIDAADAVPARGNGLDLAMVAMLLALGTTLFAYLLYTVLRHLV